MSRNWKNWYFGISLKSNLAFFLSACPQVFSSGGTCTLLPSFLGVHPNFWGCNVPSNSSFGGTKKMNCIFSTQGHAFCILRVIDTGLSLLYRVGENFFFCLTLGQTGTGVLCLSHHFFVILYITCHILFLYRTECKITYSHDH